MHVSGYFMEQTLESKNFNELIELFASLFPTQTMQSLGYYIVINHDLFKTAEKSLSISFEQLLFEDFARGQSSHMTEGIFGQHVWTQKMQFSKTQVISSLLQCATAGNRLLKCLVSMKKCEVPLNPDWKTLKYSLNRLCEEFRIFRNALEHIEETIQNGLTPEIENSWRFSRHRIFDYEVKQKKYTFDFTEGNTSHLALLNKLYEDFIQMLRNRQLTKNSR